ncbi:rho GTPase-activating protein 21 isoform X2 [Chironomus tepperi]|uniref:rho GTPase-activating protein 21 isoform X2 n=1 Tax=Chironomus tepperi TaxID=113505 RepID=UPI00391FACAB
MDGPRTIVLQRQNGAFGFTLRHFIVYPPDVQDPAIAKKLEQCGLANFSQPMDTVFVKKVIPNSEADNAGLKEGDRLIAVNGISVSLQFQFADIVATIQKTPKTLVIQIVPKCYDILQTFFSETAHNPETNQRPQAQQAVRSSLMPIMSSNKRQQEQFSLQSVPEKQEALYSPLMPIINTSNRNVYAGNGNPMAIVQPRVLQNMSQVQYDQQQQFQQQGFKNQFAAGINTEIKDAILSRLRHQIEQKEEFLKRPNKPLILEPTPEQGNRDHAHFQQRATLNFPQPNRLKPDNFADMNLDYGRSLDSMRQPQSVSQELSDIQSNRFALREQFFKDRSSTNNAYFSLPTSPYYIQDGQPSNNISFIGSSSSMMEGSTLRPEDNRHLRVIGSSPIPSQGLRIVSERTKQFESGRPLSPDGIDRTSLYKSELSRINTKPLVSNVALRRQVFEAKANIDSSWRCSSDDKIKDDKELKSLPVKARSLSVESMKENDKLGDAIHINHINNNNTLMKKERPKPVRENSYLTAVRSSPEVLPVILRQKLAQRAASDDEERKTRRTSYLKATANDEYHFTASDTDQNSVSVTADDEEIQQQLKVHASKAKALSYFRDNALSDVNIAITKQGILHVKVTLINGRRSHDRNWRQCNAELKRNILKLTILREGKVSQSPDSSGGTIDLTNFDVTDGNYTKRKNVFRLSSANYPAACDSECELLLQTQSSQEMSEWMSCLKSVARNDVKTDTECSADVGIQKAEPQRIAAIETMQASTLSSDDNPSPLAKTQQRKYHFGSRSPSGQSPVTKSRKAPQNLLVTSSSLLNPSLSDKETNSPKQKSTWKHFVTNQFKKMQPQNDSPTSNVSEGCTLSQCTPSEENFYVPLIISKCTKIVETRGMCIVGIYRIPGNTAAISNLNELINRNGMDEQTLNDPKWEDVNVVSSLLKLFIRSLSEPIVSNELYGNFIEADKKPEHSQRFQELKSLLGKLPRHNYETLKHLIAHLYKVSDNASVNLMEPRNLAIVFGPSIVRKSNDSLEMVVKDMRHQCQIVESLISHYGYFFENEPMPSAKIKIYQASTDSGSELPSADFLLENVAKIEPLTKDVQKDTSSRFVANIVQAANRKIRKTTQRRSTSSSMTPDSLSLESMTTSAESKDLQKANPKMSKLKSNESLAETPRSSEDDFDSAFTENCENGSTSLTATVTALLDNKLRSLRNSSVESDKEDNVAQSETLSTATSVSSSSTSTTISNSNPRYSVISKMTHLQHPRPLTLGENIPFADESPERPLIQARVKPIRQSLSNNNNNNNSSSNNSEKQKVGSELQMDQSKNDKSSSKLSLESSSDTDSSTTSNYREHMRSVIRLEDSVLRKVNRILTNLEHLERKYSLNRSLSLNYKSHRSSNNNNECCCANKGDKVRLSLTKDEKTDKNINKRRQLHDTTNTTNNSQSTGGNSKYRRHNGSRSIRRRHTIGIGAHDYDYNNPTIIKTSDRTSFMTPITN